MLNTITNINPMEQMDNKGLSIGFALANITTEQFASIEENIPQQGNEIGIDINFRFSADEKSKMIGVFTNFTFHTQGKQFLIVEGGCHFKIKPEDWEKLLSEDKKELTAPAGLLRHLATITVGTTRGILHAKTENTCFSKYILPTINIVKVVSEPSIFKFTGEE